MYVREKEGVRERKRREKQELEIAGTNAETLSWLVLCVENGRKEIDIEMNRRIDLGYIHIANTLAGQLTPSP